MKIQVAFKKEAKGVFAKLIRWWTKSKYSHVEIIIRDKWISSQGKSGVHVLDLKPLNHTKYDYYTIDVSSVHEKTVWDFIHSVEDSKYDWSGILWCQVFRITRAENQKKWFCSEIVTRVLQEFHYPKVANVDAANISPKDLHYLIT